MELTFVRPQTVGSDGDRNSLPASCNPEGVFQANIGSIVRLRYGSQVESVEVISVDRDGLLCRAATSAARQDTVDWWIAFSDIEGAQLPDSTMSLTSVPVAPPHDSLGDNLG
jgi:hypothetical protein